MIFVNILMTHDQSEIFHQLVYQTDDKTITRIRTEGQTPSSFGRNVGFRFEGLGFVITV